MRRLFLLVLIWLCAVLTACAASEDQKHNGGVLAVPAETTVSAAASTPQATAATTTQQEPTAPLAEAAPPLATASPRHTSTAAAPKPTLAPDAWRNAAVLPELNAHALAVLEEGLARGANPHAFSKIGDCESQTTWFLGHYDLGEEHYHLGSYQTELEPAIDYYSGSFNRLSLAARQGFTAASLLAPIWANQEVCEKGESPLACEYRIHRPLFAFIMVGTNDATNPDTFEGHMRRVIEYSLEQSVLPILGTKADNIEGDHQINATIARLAYEYDVPLWNYWSAVQDLPGHGLQEDGAHLTYSGPFFDRPNALRRAWPVRNLNALQILRMMMDATR